MWSIRAGWEGAQAPHGQRNNTRSKRLALRSAMREQGVSNVRLAELLNISESAVRRLVNPDHLSRLDGVVAALAVLGRRPVIEDLVAA